MLVKDAQTQDRLQRGDVIEAQQHLAGKQAEDRRSDYRIVERSGRDITDLDLQKGSSLFASEFCKKLKPLMPEMTWQVHPTKSDKLIILNRGELAVIGDYPWMPEWSVFEESYETLPARSPEFMETKEGYNVEYFHPGIPTMKKVAVGYFEVNRGWRTVLMRLILNKHVNLVATEKVFGRGNRASWAVTLEFYGVGPRDLVF